MTIWSNDLATCAAPLGLKIVRFPSSSDAQGDPGVPAGTKVLMSTLQMEKLGRGRLFCGLGLSTPKPKSIGKANR